MRTLSKLQNERDTVEALVTGHPWDVKKVSSLGLVTYKKVKVPSLYGSWDKQGFVKVAVSIGSISAVSRVRSLILPSSSFGGWVRAHFPKQRLVIEPTVSRAIENIRLQEFQ